MRCHNLLCSISLTEIVPFTNWELANRSFHSNIDGRIFREKKVLVLHRVVCAVVKIVGFDMSLISSVVHIDSLIEVIWVNSLNLGFIPVIKPFVSISILKSVLPGVLSIDFNVVGDRGWVEWNDVSVGSLAEFPDTATDLFSFVENGRGPVVSVVADVGATQSQSLACERTRQWRRQREERVVGICPRMSCSRLSSWQPSPVRRQCSRDPWTAPRSFCSRTSIQFELLSCRRHC